MRHPKAPTVSRQFKILESQNYQCFYCGSDLHNECIEYDHIEPWVYDYNNKKDNLVASCKICNNIKSSKVFDDIEDIRNHIISQRKKRRLSSYDFEGN